MTAAPQPAPARFTFDLDLGGRTQATRVVNESTLDGLLEEARRKGHAQGVAEGERAAAAVAAKQLAAAVEKLAARAGGAIAGADGVQRDAVAEAASLAVAVGRKLAGALLERFPHAELLALAEDCLRSLEGAPHLVIRCHPDVADAMREAVGAKMEASGFAGRLVVIADPERGLSDGRIEWADGGLVRDLETASAAIDRAVDAFLAARIDNQEATR